MYSMEEPKNLCYCHIDVSNSRIEINDIDWSKINTINTHETKACKVWDSVKVKYVSEDAPETVEGLVLLCANGRCLLDLCL